MNREIFKDKKGTEIKAGDTVRNPWNEPADIDVLADSDGNLFLGDYETPFGRKYCFDEFWEVVK